MTKTVSGAILRGAVALELLRYLSISRHKHTELLEVLVQMSLEVNLGVFVFSSVPYMDTCH